KDIGTLLGMIKEATPVTPQLDDNKIRAIIRQELTNMTTGRSTSSSNSNSSSGSNSRRLSPKETQRDQEAAD
ncbi:MAG TPA: hypothetical protein VE692_01560, partial [Nitrososphaera sp.]|nr:hypothetical protein [Nitrososphaera sp.]